MRSRWLLVAGSLLALGLTPPATAAKPHGEWVAGDLHVHTMYGHDTCITPT